MRVVLLLMKGVPSKWSVMDKAANFDNEEIQSNHAAGSFAYSCTLAVVLFGFHVNFRNCRIQPAKWVD